MWWDGVMLYAHMRMGIGSKKHHYVPKEQRSWICDYTPSDYITQLSSLFLSKACQRIDVSKITGKNWWLQIPLQKARSETRQTHGSKMWRVVVDICLPKQSNWQFLLSPCNECMISKTGSNTRFMKEQPQSVKSFISKWDSITQICTNTRKLN